MSTVALTFIVIAVVAVLVVRFLGWALAPFIGNIIAGGLLYWLIDALLMRLPWTMLDAIIVALFGVPGTIAVAIFRALF